MYQNCNILWNEKNPHPLFLSLKEPCVQQIYCILEILKMEFLEKKRLFVSSRWSTSIKNCFAITLWGQMEVFLQYNYNSNTNIREKNLKFRYSEHLRIHPF